MQSRSRLRKKFGMKALLGALVLLSATVFLACGEYTYGASAGVGYETAGSTDDVSYLAQFGTWIDVPDYGMCWQPSVTAGWRPFEYGHWVWTESGWAWVSYEPYGWLVFHYGNWDYQPDIGWFWIEGSDWSPAPVEWRTYDGFCSWAPLPPAGVVWQDPWSDAGLRFWVSVRSRDFDRDNIVRYSVDRLPQPREFDRSADFRRPLGLREFQRFAGHPVRTVTLSRGPAQVYMNPGHPGGHFTMGESRGPNRQMPPDRHRVEFGQRGNHQSVAPPPENRAQVAQRVPLNRMILPHREEARVQRYQRQFEQRVLVARGRGNQPFHASTNTRHRK
ncbi:hypothetical protein C3F09_09255 [candidate division GN15 bacterium]|uniref:Uncharacterized protein n=1 Tax=candidate division GN15 bacterium TaxID=2072418 RepID=A0A855WZ78_9BACT|nr:MAG: hypothetical protein C3F09_09255 [candidate division GN15 bacterium]